MFKICFKPEVHGGTNKSFLCQISPVSQKVGVILSKLYHHVFFAFVVAVGAVFCGPRQAKAEFVITNLAQIRTLSREEAAKAYPVRIQGTVTWKKAGNSAFVIDDGTQAVYVDTTRAKKGGFSAMDNLPATENEPGAIVEVEGVTDPAGYAPILVCMKIKRIGSGTVLPRHLEMDKLLSGSADAFWVEVNGVVQSIIEDQSLYSGIRLLVGGQICRVVFESNQGLNVTNLIDADVRVRGVLTPVYNMRSEVVGLKLSANSARDIDVLLPAPDNPFLAPKVPLNKLRLFTPNSTAAFHRKVTQGVVNFAIPHQFFFLEDSNSGVRAKSSSEVVQVGEKIEVAGFVDPLQNIVALNGVIVHSLGTVVLSPISTTAEQILHPPMEGSSGEIAKSDLNYRLVKIRGKLIQFDRGGNAGFCQMLVKTGGHTVMAFLPQLSITDSQAVAPWMEGAELELTGVCEYDFKEDVDRPSTISISDFHLWLRSPQDVRITRAPSWWTVRRLWIALAGMFFLIFAGIIWSSSLHLLLKKRTGLLEEVMSTHRNVELEFSAARRERLRLAGDLHDGLKQLIAAASFRLEAAEGYLPDSPLDAAKHLTSAHATLIRTQEELQECMKGLHVLEEGPPELEALFHQMVASADYWPQGIILIESRGASRRLPRDVAGSLLLLFQEAVANALRHGLASQIKVLVDYTPDSLNLRIADNGIGFEPASAPGINSGHFGLDGMKKRVKWLKGEFDINHHEGGGMEIIVKIKWSAIPQTKLNQLGQAD